MVITSYVWLLAELDAAKRRDAVCNSKHKTQWPIKVDVDDTAKHLLSEMHPLSSLTFKPNQQYKIRENELLMAYSRTTYVTFN